jgi:hypothetical protein
MYHTLTQIYTNIKIRYSPLQFLQNEVRIAVFFKCFNYVAFLSICIPSLARVTVFLLCIL